MSSVVYFISDGAGAIKIGISTDISRRLSGLQTGTSRPLHLIGHVPGDRSQERQLHQALHEHRMSGEWFLDCSAVRATMRQVLDLGLEVCGFSSCVEETVEARGLAEARRLAEIIARCTGASLASGPDVIYGVPRALLWRARYRPGKDIYVDELDLLRAGALRATDAAVLRAYEDREFVVAMCEADEYQDRIIDHLDARLASLKDRLRRAKVAA